MKYKLTKLFYVFIVLLAVGFLILGWLYIKSMWTTGNRINIMMIFAVELHNYYEQNGSYPTPCVKKQNNMHSWRVMLLPPERQDLYAAYRFNEPWNSKNNIKLLDKMPIEYKSPAATSASFCTNYLLPMGKEAAWSEDRCNFDKITDYRMYTIVLVEVLNSDIKWLEPRDLAIDEISPSVLEKMLQGAYYLNAFNHVGQIPPGTPYKVIHAMFTINGGEKIYESPDGELKIEE